MNVIENTINGYIYVRNHQSYDIDDVCKIGKAKNIPDRDTQYATGEIMRGYFEAIFSVPIKQMGIIERLVQNEFSNLNVKYNAGTEFFSRKVIPFIEPYLTTLGVRYKKLSQQEISNLLRCNRVKETVKKINIQSLIQMLKSKRTDEQYFWNEREYQKTTIDFCKNELTHENKVYIDMPTGGGKSCIVYNLFNYLKSEFIIIFSPRKIVNSQNVSEKYLQILKDDYITFNYSTNNNFDEYMRLPNKKIVICCTQSVSKIYEKILSNSITNITIWFDEAHWGVEDWVDNLNDNINSQFWLLDNKHIKYRIFTSASPDKQKIIRNENIFGELYSPIKVRELINLNWLSEIKPYVYSENKENVDNINYIISDFNEKNKKFGFSFHNKQKNAFNLFYKHYTHYKHGKTHVKPFLLVSNNFNIEKEPKLQEIVLEYNYRDVKTFETTIYSIGYVVAKYSMGYDFNKLDFMCLSDPKLSTQDIKQCIGRGTRPDKLGENGSNKEKILVVSLPVYIDDNSDDKYEKIIEVLKYLLYDVEIPFKEIEFKNRCEPHHNEVKHISNGCNSNEYDGINDVKSTLLNLLELENKKTALGITYKKAKNIIADKNIKSKEEYYELCEKDNRLSIEPEIIFKGQFTNWIDYLNIERVYYDLETCRNKVNEYLLMYPELKKHYLDLATMSNELCKIDVLFPPNRLWVEYYNVKDLRDIITIIHNKKNIGVNL